MVEQADIKKAAVIGQPVAGSLSPRLHGYWLNHYNIAGEYSAREVPPLMLEEILHGLPMLGYVGVNVTVPHKEAAFHLMDECDDAAQKTGAVNTVIFSGGKRIGKNTDVYGFIQNLKSVAGDLSPYKRKAIVLGAGGAARAIVAGLSQEGFEEIVITNRTLERAKQLAASLQPHAKTLLKTANWLTRAEILKDTGLMVNATTLGMQGDKPLAISLEALPKEALVADIVYKPLITPLLERAKARGNKTIDGLGMLLWQAQPAFESWFGIRPEVDAALREYVITK